MTREEAIEFIAQSVKSDVDMALVADAIKALEQEPTTKHDLEVDCISRDSAIKALDYDIKYFEFKSGVSKYMDDIAKLLNTIYETQVNNIKALPSVTPQESKTGHWIKSNIGGAKVCSVCNAHMGLSSFKFCPSCGARMVEPQESEVNNE